jgi:hypothetical protein
MWLKMYIVLHVKYRLFLSDWMKIVSLLWCVDILCVYSQREYWEFIANRQGVKQEVRAGNVPYAPAPVQTVRLLLLLRPSPSIQISRATGGIQKCLRSRATNLNWGHFLIISQVTSISIRRTVLSLKEGVVSSRQIFEKILEYQISLKSLQWEWRCFMWKEGRTDGQK